MSQVNSFNIAKHKKVLGENIVIMKVGHFIDVFYGNDGFNDHARFVGKKTPKGIFITQLTGERIPTDVYKNILSKVN